MSNLLIKLFILFILFLSNSYSEIIKDIEVVGNKRISKQTILVLGDLKINKDFDDILLNSTLKELYETNFFSDIKLSINNGLLKIIVTENPIIEKININGIKKKTFVENIYSSISLKDRTSYNDFKLQEDIILVKNRCVYVSKC